MRSSLAQRYGRERAVLCSVVLLLPWLWPHLYSPLSPHMPTLFSEWQTPRPRFPSLLEAAISSRSQMEEPSHLWSQPDSGAWAPCIFAKPFPAKKTLGYLQVFLEGGLNQQRMAICDAVAVARLLEVTLVLPQLDINPFWQDSSSFADIFDVDNFLQTLEEDVLIVKDVPRQFLWSTREYYATGIRATRIKHTPARAPPSWFIANVLPVIQSYGIAAVVPFSHRLAYDEIPIHIQQLRCKVNFKALRFAHRISLLGDTIVSRLRSSDINGENTDVQAANQKRKTSLGNNTAIQTAKFIALHLRFDKDMAAHSACDFGGGKIEQLALAKYRRDLWQGRVSNSQHSDAELRKQGKCPLTPEEIGLMLAALGFGPQTRLYLASYKVYGGAPRMAAIHMLFPLMESKYSLTTDEEIAPLKDKASLLAALDYYVSLQSDVFISASPGNMHNALVGHRAYNGVKKTIRPNLAILLHLFANTNMTIQWEEFCEMVLSSHRHRIGDIKLRQVGQSLYTYPAPDCICKRNMNSSFQVREAG